MARKKSAETLAKEAAAIIPRPEADGLIALKINEAYALRERLVELRKEIVENRTGLRTDKKYMTEDQLAWLDRFYTPREESSETPTEEGIKEESGEVEPDVPGLPSP